MLFQLLSGRVTDHPFLSYEHLTAEVPLYLSHKCLQESKGVVRGSAGYDAAPPAWHSLVEGLLRFEPRARWGLAEVVASEAFRQAAAAHMAELAAHPRLAKEMADLAHMAGLGMQLQARPVEAQAAQVQVPGVVGGSGGSSADASTRPALALLPQPLAELTAGPLPTSSRMQQGAAEVLGVALAACEPGCGMDFHVDAASPACLRSPEEGHGSAAPAPHAASQVVEQCSAKPQAEPSSTASVRTAAGAGPCRHASGSSARTSAVAGCRGSWPGSSMHARLCSVQPSCNTLSMPCLQLECGVKRAAVAAAERGATRCLTSSAADGVTDAAPWQLACGGSSTAAPAPLPVAGACLPSEPLEGRGDVHVPRPGCWPGLLRSVLRHKPQCLQPKTWMEQAAGRLGLLLAHLS